MDIYLVFSIKTYILSPSKLCRSFSLNFLITGVCDDDQSLNDKSKQPPKSDEKYLLFMENLLLLLHLNEQILLRIHLLLRQLRRLEKRMFQTIILIVLLNEEVGKKSEQRKLKRCYMNDMGLDEWELL